MTTEQPHLPQVTDPIKFGQLMQIPEAERTPEQKEALDLHGRLVYDRAMVEVGIVSMCRDLKAIRDGKHYVTLGFENFGEYTEQMHGIGERQAYNYIRVYEKLGGEVLNLNSKIGVTKLLELASLDNDERQKLLAAHPVEKLESMSTAEVKRLTEQVKKLQEQISIFESAESSEPDTEQLRMDIQAELEADYTKRITALESKAKSEAEASAKSEISDLKFELKQARSDMKANTEAIKAAEARAKEAEKKAAQAVEFEFKFKKLEAEKEAMEKQIRMSSDPELTRFKYMFESWQSATSAMFDQLGKLDKDTQDKMCQAVKAVMGDRIC